MLKLGRGFQVNTVRIYTDLAIPVVPIGTGPSPMNIIGKKDLLTPPVKYSHFKFYKPNTKTGEYIVECIHVRCKGIGNKKSEIRISIYYIEGRISTAK